MKYLKIAAIIFIFYELIEASEKDVLNNIFEGYDTRIRPIKNASLPVTIYIQPLLIRLSEVNTQQEYIKVLMSLDQTWKDEFLSWDPADYNETEEVSVSTTAVWLPNTFIATTSFEPVQIIDKDRQMVTVKSDGTIFFSSPFVLSNYCEMKTDEFPYDQQQCMIRVGSWQYTNKKLLFEPLSNKSIISRNKNSEWNILPVTYTLMDSTVDSGQYRRIQYTMTIKRKPAYYFWVLIMPTLIITALSIAGIFAPINNVGDRQEKVTLGLTTLLTLAVILSMVTGEMPRTTNLPLLVSGQFVLVELGIIVICMTISVIILFLHQRATTRHCLVPRWLARYLICCSTNERSSKVDVSKSATTAHDFNGHKRNTHFQLMIKELKSKNSVKGLDISIQLLDDAVTKMNDYINKKENERKTEEDKELRKEQWLILFDHVDLLLFVFFQNRTVNSTERDVYAEIFKDYQKDIRPVRDDKTTIVVQIQPQIICLLEVNEEQEYIKVAIYINQVWTDEYLSWDPADFNGTTVIRVPASKVWLPDVSVNSQSLEPEYFMPPEDRNVLIYSNGSVYLSFPFVLTNYCKMEIKEFPFDTQECPIVLLSWTYPKTQLYLEHFLIDQDASLPQNNSTVWEIFPYVNDTYETIFKTESYMVVYYYQKMKRKSAYYIWVLIAPTFIITALSLAGLYAPFNNSGDREEKITLGLTTLLTLAVILSMVTGEMPRGSSLPLLGRFVLAEIVMIVISMAISIITLFLHQRATTRLWPVPSWLNSILLCNPTGKDKVYDEQHVLFEKAFSNNWQLEVPLDLKTQSAADEASLLRACLPQISAWFKGSYARINGWLNNKDEELAREHHWLLVFDRLDLILFLFCQLIHTVAFVLIFYPYSENFH